MEIILDIETYSDVSLENGVYKYSESIDFEVLSISVSINGEPVVVYDLASGEELPSNVVKALFDDKVIKWAHNAIFERICLTEWLKKTYPLFYKQYGRSYLNPTCWRCTMVLGMYYGLPASLSDMGKALKLENQKLEEGKKLVKNFCQPCKPTSGNNYRTRNLPAHNPDEWKLFLEYNRRDVEVALEIKAILSKYQLPQNFWQEYALDQEINDRGILVDTNSVSNAVRFCEQYMADTTVELKNLTGIDNPNSIQQMKAWLESKDIKVASLDKNAVDALMLTVPADIKTILTLYRKMKKTSVAKYTKMFNARGRDGRIRGAFQFYGANRTGRWSGRQVQFQNLPRGNTADFESAMSLLKAGNYGDFKAKHDSVLETLAGLIRTMIIPSNDLKLIVADYSACCGKVKL